MEIDDLEHTLRDIEAQLSDVSSKLNYLIESLKDLRNSYYSYPLRE